MNTAWVAVFMLAVTPACAFAAPGTAATDKQAARDKRICKVTADTGSFLKKTRVCKTSSQWQKEREQARQTGESMRPHTAVVPGG